MSEKKSPKAYDVVTERVIALLEKGVAPWRRPWRGGEAAPRNAVSQRPYRGVNALLLGTLGFVDPRFVTFRQAHALGGCVRKGEKGFPVVFFRVIGRDVEAGDEKRGYALLRYSTAFNVAQCDGLELEALPVAPPEQSPIEACERIAASYLPGPLMLTGGQACYAPLTDAVTMPPRAAFESPAEYYSTLFHELAHSTGHADRLARPGVTEPTWFRSHQYSREELVAEMTSCFLCSEAAIDAATIDNSAAYLGSWLHALRAEPRMVLESAAAAQKAADLILGRERAEVAA